MTKLSGDGKKDQHFAGILALVVVCSLAGGGIGFIMALSMVFISSKNIFRDRADKHGISVRTSSRFGGPVIGFGALGFGFALMVMSESGFSLSQTGFSLELQNSIFVALLVGSVGLWEDYAARFTALLRLQLHFFIVGAFFLFFYQTLPSDVFPSGYLQFLNHPIAVGLGMTVCVVGFINAGNIADGANGLLSGIAIVVLLIGYLESESFALLSLLASTLVFSLFNLLTGELFLGDSGAYFLSSLMALVCIDLYMQGTSSVWFYACLLSYPCVELVRIIFVRWSGGASPFEADNNHLHNKVFEKLKKVGLSPLAGNTCTGLFLAALSSAFPLVAYLTSSIPLNASTWLWVFCCYSLIHLFLARYLDTSS